MNKVWGKVKVASMVCVTLTTIVFNSFVGVANAISGFDGTINYEPVTVDGITLSKNVKTVDGMVNAWDVTMRIESPKQQTTSDTVMVIDTSWSMNDNGKMNEAKEAAKSLARQLLPEGNTTNRIAIVSFNSDITTSNFGSGNAFAGVYSAVENRINNLRAQYKGATFTQAGIREAAKLLEASTADIKNIVLLSDGEPTFNYAINNPSDYLVEGGPNEHQYSGDPEMQTSVDVPEEAFDYTDKKGGGSSMWGRYEDVLIGTALGSSGKPYNVYEHRYYNSGNCAIAEAGFYKDSNIGDLYTISFDNGEMGDEVLAQIASPGKSYRADVGSLRTIFDEVTGNIKSTIQLAHVVDLLERGIVVANDSEYGVYGADMIDWVPILKYDSNVGKYIDELTYRVEVNADIVNNLDEDGYVSLSSSTVLRYNDDRMIYFPVPKVKPVDVNITKEVVGRECIGCKFVVEITCPGDIKKNIVVQSGETVRIVERLAEGTYGVLEVGGDSDNIVRFEDFSVEYSEKSFILDRNNNEDINITIRNIGAINNDELEDGSEIETGTETGTEVETTEDVDDTEQLQEADRLVGLGGLNGPVELSYVTTNVNLGGTYNGVSIKAPETGHVAKIQSELNGANAAIVVVLMNGFVCLGGIMMFAERRR